MAKGVITLMGSGEFSGSMVAVHKNLLQPYGAGVSAVFLDTPAGFQLNVDDLGAKAVAYFDHHIQQSLTVVSLKQIKDGDPLVLSKAYDLLGRADYILMGPGSPTYALDQWQGSRIPEIFARHLETGGTLVASSAAALTLGSKCLPVYEIYKIGQRPHWVEGLQLLDGFGCHWAVMPHWNNTEGGNHDTRFCFMGEQRLKALILQLPDSVNILGIDEHTALEIDLAGQTAKVKGIGRVNLVSRDGQRIFEKGDPIALDVMREGQAAARAFSPGPVAGRSTEPESGSGDGEAQVWQHIHDLEARVKSELEKGRIENATGSLLDLESHLNQNWTWLRENEALGAARDVFRELLADLGTHVASRSGTGRDDLTALVDGFVTLRDELREKKQWTAADAIRHGLQNAGIVINDTADGGQWRFED